MRPANCRRKNVSFCLLDDMDISNSKMLCWKKILALGLLLWLLSAVTAAGQAAKINLDNGVALSIREIPSHKGLPHSSYDQAMNSIPALYPQHEILIKRRYGKLGPVIYSLVCYRDDKRSDKFIVNGAAIHGEKAWTFDVEAPAESFHDTLVLILEAISRFPSIIPLQPVN